MWNFSSQLQVLKILVNISTNSHVTENEIEAVIQVRKFPYRILSFAHLYVYWIEMTFGTNEKIFQMGLFLWTRVFNIGDRYIFHPLPCSLEWRIFFLENTQFQMGLFLWKQWLECVFYVRGGDRIKENSIMNKLCCSMDILFEKFIIKTSIRFS